MVTYRPASLAEALEIRAAKKAVPFAGGTDLMVRYRAKNGLNPTVPGPVMFVDGIPELRGAELTPSSLELGASLPMAVLAGDPGCRAAWEANTDDNPVVEGALEAVPAVLRDAAASLGAPGLRQRATLAGNLANASPAGDTVAALYACDAAVVLQSVRGERVVPIAEFITGPGRTVLAGDELITSVRILADPHDWYYWRKVGTRRANALTKVSVAAVARFGTAPGTASSGEAASSGPGTASKTGTGSIASFAMAFGAVGPTVVRVSEAEAMIRDASAGIDLHAVREIIQPHITPIDDQRSTAKYRKTVALNLAQEALRSLVAHIIGETK